MFSQGRRLLSSPLPQKLSNKLPSWKSILLRSLELRIYNNQPNKSPELWSLNVFIQNSERVSGNRVGPLIILFIEDFAQSFLNPLPTSSPRASFTWVSAASLDLAQCILVPTLI